METTATIETTASAARSFSEQTPGEQVFSLFIFGLGLAASGVFAYYLITEPGRLTQLWAWVRSLPLIVQGVIWLLFLPWMIALWVWTLPWALPVRLVLVAGVLAWTTWMLYPWK
ncbi:MAG: hypothetical protein ACYC77_11110 [Coriobacteriia bacterium]